jgi:hypothetical protein
MQPHPDQVAARLGLDETTIARLRAGGQLERLALTQPEIRERLYRAHAAYLLAQVAKRVDLQRSIRPDPQPNQGRAGPWIAGENYHT